MKHAGVRRSAGVLLLLAACAAPSDPIPAGAPPDHAARIGRGDFGGYDARDLSFTPRFVTIPACGLRFPTDPFRWRREDETQPRWGDGRGRTIVRFQAREALGSYNPTYTPILKHPTVSVFLFCHPPINDAAEHMAASRAFQRRRAQEREYRRTLLENVALTLADGTPALMAPYLDVFPDGSEASGATVVWDGPDGVRVRLWTRIAMGTRLPRPAAWNHAWTRALVERSRLSPHAEVVEE